MTAEYSVASGKFFEINLSQGIILYNKQFSMTKTIENILKRSALDLLNVTYLDALNHLGFCFQQN